MTGWNYLFCHNYAKIQLSMTIQKGHKVMNNQEIEEALAKLDQPEGKFLRYITRWINSTMGILLDVAALIMAIIVAINFNSKPAVISNWIFCIAGSYILIYEVFDLTVIKQAIRKNLSGFIIDIIGGFFIMAPVIIFMLPFVDNETPLIYKLLLVILDHMFEICLLGSNETKRGGQRGYYPYILSYLLQIRQLYLKRKFKNNKLFKLASPIFYKKARK